MAEVEPLVAAYPLRERLCGQLMLGLYRSGRQAERCGPSARFHLVDELGITPSPDLVRLESAILQQHAALEPPGRELPSGVVTFVLTDVEGSTGLWESDPDAMAVALARHDAVGRRRDPGGGRHAAQVEGRGRQHVLGLRAGDGRGGGRARLQQDLAATTWPAGLACWCGPPSTGEPLARDGDYGPAVNRAARLRAVAAPGQVVVSRSTAELVADHLPDDVGLQEVATGHCRAWPVPSASSSCPPGAEPSPVAPGARPPAGLVARSRADDPSSGAGQSWRSWRAWARAEPASGPWRWWQARPAWARPAWCPSWRPAPTPRRAGARRPLRRGLRRSLPRLREALAPLLAYGPAVAALDGMGELGAELGSLVPEVSACVPGRARCSTPTRAPPATGSSRP